MTTTTTTFTRQDVLDAMFAENMRNLARTEGCSVLRILREVSDCGDAAADARNVEAGRARYERGEQILLTTRLVRSQRTTHGEDRLMWDAPEAEIVSEVYVMESGYLAGMQAYRQIALAKN